MRLKKYMDEAVTDAGYVVSLIAGYARDRGYGAGLVAWIEKELRRGIDSRACKYAWTRGKVQPDSNIQATTARPSVTKCVRFNGALVDWLSTQSNGAIKALTYDAAIKKFTESVS